MVVFCVQSCSEKQAEREESKESIDYVEIEGKLRLVRKKGALCYTERCAGCHGSDGVGGGAFPPLDGSDFVTGDPQRLALIIHKGVFGPITVKGKTYNLDRMPGWEGEIGNDELSKIMTYVRGSWSNSSQVTKEDQLITPKMTEQWIKEAKHIEGPLSADTYASGLWKKLILKKKN